MIDAPAHRRPRDVFLDLDADLPPVRPKSFRWPVIGIRIPAHLKAYLEQRVFQDGTTINHYVRTLIEADRHGLPADCREWLVKQAAQCGVPGRPEEALVLVLRHLADRWPDGARLR